MREFLKQNWLLILSLLYIFSPVDFIPEIILGPFGAIDDVGVLLSLLGYSAFKYFVLHDNTPVELPQAKQSK